MLQAPARRNENTGTGSSQQQAEHQRGGGFEAAMAVGVGLIGSFGTLAVGPQYEGIGDDVGERMHRVGDQADRVGDQADDDLHRRQYQIDADADPGDSLAGGEALRR
jgi:hypothetical protein